MNFSSPNSSPQADLRTFLCNQCGATLHVKENTRFVHCQYCDASLRVEEHSGTILSEVVEEIQENQQQFNTKLELIKLQNQLLALEQSWTRSQKHFTSYGNNGQPSLPSEHAGQAGCAVSVIIAAFALFFFMIQEPNIDGGFILIPILVGLGALGIGLYIYFSSNNHYQDYKRAKTSYQRKRSSLMQQIAQLERGQSSPKSSPSSQTRKLIVPNSENSNS